MSEDPSLLPRELHRWVNQPYGGLFGGSVIARVVEELIADPDSEYRIRDLSELLDASSSSVKKALNTLEDLKLVIKKNRDSQRPIYSVNVDSRTFTALTFLTYALNDDRDGTEFMLQELLDYCDSIRQSAGEEMVIAQYQGSHYIIGDEGIRIEMETDYAQIQYSGGVA